jgi:DNA mismatch repair protein MutL
VLDGTSDALNIVKDNREKTQLNTANSLNDYVTHKSVLTDVLNYKKEVVEEKNALRITLSDSSPKYDIKTIEEKQKSENVSGIFAENKAFLESLEKKKIEAVSQESISIKRKLNYIGQALNTFLIFDDGVDIFFADQHAAHERILFDKFNDSLNNHEIVSQPLLLPFILNVSNLEYDFINLKIDVLNEMGIEICEFGKNAFKVSAVPSFLTEMNIQTFFNDLLSELDSLKSLTINSLLTDKIAQKACKAAIKAGDKLSQLEINVLTEKLNENIGLKCPHGRPVAIKISRMEIDKWFKRIV